MIIDFKCQVWIPTLFNKTVPTVHRTDEEGLFAQLAGCKRSCIRASPLLSPGTNQLLESIVFVVLTQKQAITRTYHVALESIVFVVLTQKQAITRTISRRLGVHSFGRFLTRKRAISSVADPECLSRIPDSNFSIPDPDPQHWDLFSPLTRHQSRLSRVHSFW
jgi:hypothetical protein